MNIVIQAGGMGTRMRNITWNKPKCLISVHNKPIIYHIFEKHPEANFFIICDHKKEILEKYFSINKPKVNFKLIEADEGNETCSGLSKCLKEIPENEEIIITWSDLLYKKPLIIPTRKIPAIYKTDCFSSRYKINNDKITKEKTDKNGVAGVFYIPDKSFLVNVEKTGSFLNWFIKNIKEYQVLDIDEIEEIGNYDDYLKILKKQNSYRFFNQIIIEKDSVLKICVDDKYSNLLKKEKKWYKEIEKYNFDFIVNIIKEEPYTLKKIKGKHLFDKNLSAKQTYSHLKNIFYNIKQIHDCDKKPASLEELKEVYVNKTINRVKQIEKILPFNNKKFITINGKKCENIFYEQQYEEKFLKLLDILETKCFTPIHGDLTLSNIIFEKEKPIFIDPRGYFFTDGVWGDPRYDIAKLYFSCIGKYDFFNKKDFILYIGNNNVEIFFNKTFIEEQFKKILLENFNDEEIKKIKIIHALIWLSMSAYAIDDVDSIIASHYLGLFYLEEAIGKTNE